MRVYHENESARVRVGIIGLGVIGWLYRRVIRDLSSRFELAGLADVLGVQDQEGIPCYSSYGQLLDGNSSAVIVATPPASHEEIVLAALSAGKHVLVEKPPALDTHSLETMKARASSMGLCLFTGFHAAFNTAVRRARAELRSVQVDEVDIQFDEDAYAYHPPGSWVFMEELGGGALLDSGINAISALTHILGMPSDTIIHGVSLASNPCASQVESHVDAIFDWGEVPIRLRMAWLQSGPERRQIDFHTPSGKYRVDLVAGVGGWVSCEDVSGDPAARVDQYQEYAGMLEEFHALMSRGQSYVSSVELELVTRLRTWPTGGHE